jgi:hypothetical protein
VLAAGTGQRVAVCSGGHGGAQRREWLVELAARVAVVRDQRAPTAGLAAALRVRSKLEMCISHGGG